MGTQTPILLWLRQDLRLSDHPALRAAIETGRPVLPVYILDEESEGVRRLGGASKWWLHHSLDNLQKAFKAKGIAVAFKRGASVDTLKSLAEETQAQAIYFTRGYTESERKAEEALFDAFRDRDVALRRFGGSLLFEPDAIRTKSDTPFKVFTPFYKACLDHEEPRAPVNAPSKINGYTGSFTSDALSQWELLPKEPDWSGGIRDVWKPGEQGAMDTLYRFLDSGLDAYEKARDEPGADRTSSLSPYLRFGEISPRRVWHAVREKSLRDHGGITRSAESFLRALCWREFSYHLLYHWPDFPHANFRGAFDDFPWADDPDGLKAWQKGQTGYPIVDAGMRQLWQTGWMHNRVRMITASFLIKDLLIDWREGEAWFWDTLVDADTANNAAGWQWVAGSGADAAPYFRIFNPVTQGQKFDPGGDYVRRWIPELSALDNKDIHAPWDAPSAALKGAGITLGKTYPEPVVDHQGARKRALEAYEAVKKQQAA